MSAPQQRVCLVCRRPIKPGRKYESFCSKKCFNRWKRTHVLSGPTRRTA